MARKDNSGEVNKSQSIRDLLKENPHITAREALTTLANRGIEIAPNQFYFVKGKMLGRKGRRRKMRRRVASVMGTSNGPAARGDVLATIRKVKGLAQEVGGLKRLQALVEALSE